MAAEATRPGTAGRQNGQHDSGDRLVLLPQHAKLIEGSGIAPEVARARGYRSCTAPDDGLLRELGFTKPQRRFPGLLVPIYNAAGELALHQYRPDHPRLVRKKPVKYETPEGSRLVLDVPRSIREQLADPTVPLVVSEGSRKVDSAISRGLVAIGVLGVDGWRGTGERGGKTALADWADIALNGRQVRICFDSDAVTKKEVARALRGFKAFLESHGAFVGVIYLPPGPDNQKVGLDDFLADGHTVDDLVSLAEDVIREPEDTPRAELKTAFHCTDLGNAERLVARHGRGLRYCYTLGAFLVWDGRRWAIDEGGAARRLAKETVRSVLIEAAQVENKETREALIDWSLKSESEGRIAALLKLAESERPLEVGVAELDTNPWLLNVRNGTVDLRDGRLLPHRREDYITKLIDVAYVPTAACPRWERFLAEVLPDDSARRFVHRAAGYSATGSARERTLIIPYGAGRNGKGVLLKTLRSLFGEYAVRAPSELFLAKREEGIPSDVAQLRGARFVYASEGDEGRRLAEAKIKDLTGGEDIPARHLYGRWFSFVPAFTPWFSTNHRPVVRGSDAAIWDRLALVPFTVRFRLPDEADDGQPGADLTLDEKLAGEREGILAWVIRGAVAWYQVGLGKPEVVRRATAEYRNDMDTLGAFLADCCVVASDATALAAALWDAWKAWSTANNEWVGSQKTLGLRLSERGFSSVKGSRGVRRWVGLRLRETNEAPPEAGGEAPRPGEEDAPTTASGGVACGVTETEIPELFQTHTRTREVKEKLRHHAPHATPPPEAAEEPADSVPYTLITDTDGLHAALPTLLTAPIIGFDCETAITAGTIFTPKKSKTGPENRTALDPTRGRLRLLQLATPRDTFVIDVFAVPDLSPLAPLFAGAAEFVAHNAAFDMNWLRAAGLPVPERVTCTMVLAQLVDAGRTRDGGRKRLEFNLEDVVGRYLGVQLDKAGQKSDWAVPELTTDQLAYGAKDASILLPLRSALAEAIRADGLETVAALETGLLPFMAELRATGMLVDAERWAGLAKHAQEEADALEPRLRAALGNPRAPKTGEPINLGSGQQLGEALEACGVTLPRMSAGQIRTDKYTLERLSDRHPAINLFRAWKAAQTAVTGFGEEKLHPSPDGRVRASFKQLGTVTGRMVLRRPEPAEHPEARSLPGLLRGAPGQGPRQGGPGPGAGLLRRRYLG